MSVSQSQTGRSGLSESGLLLLLPGLLPHFLHLHLFPDQLPTTPITHSHSLLPFISLLPMLIQWITNSFYYWVPYFKSNYCRFPDSIFCVAVRERITKSNTCFHRYIFPWIKLYKFV